MLYDQYFIDDLKDRADLVRGLILIAIIFTVGSLCTFGQEPGEAILVDEFGVLPCDNFLGRLDMFLGELRNDPESRGYVVISNDPTERHRSVYLAEMMRKHFTSRNWDINPIELVRSDSDSGLLMQFFRIPKGGSPPKLDRSVWSYKISDTTREPFLLATETKFGAVICPAVNVQQIFANFIKENKTARGNIVVSGRTISQARQHGSKIIQIFSRRYGISRSRLRVFPVLFLRPPNHDETLVEYWLLP